MFLLRIDSITVRALVIFPLYVCFAGDEVRLVTWLNWILECRIDGVLQISFLLNEKLVLL